MGNCFETKVKPILKYVGTIGAVLMSIAYIGIVLLLVFGFSATASLAQSFSFALVNAVMGLVIMQFLKVQGIDLAKEIEENKIILKEYYSTKTKDKKFRSIKHYWTVSLITDIIVKGLTLASTTLGIIYIVIVGTQNYAWLLLAVVNLIMFACFGLIALVGAYDFFNENHIPYVKERLNENKEEQRKKEEAERAERERLAEQQAIEREKAIEREIERRLALVKKELDQQRDDNIHDNRGANILEPLDSVGDNGAIQPVFLDTNGVSDSVLGVPANTSDTNTAVDNILIEENTQQNKEEETMQ